MNPILHHWPPTCLLFGIPSPFPCVLSASYTFIQPPNRLCSPAYGSKVSESKVILESSKVGIIIIIFLKWFQEGEDTKGFPGGSSNCYSKIISYFTYIFPRIVWSLAISAKIVFFSFLFCFCLFIWHRKRQREREHQQGGVGEGEAGLPPSREPNTGLDPRVLGSCPVPKADTQQLSHPHALKGCILEPFLYVKVYLQNRKHIQKTWPLTGFGWGSLPSNMHKFT